jgi:hypothetical protein
MMGTWMCGSGIQVWGCKIPLFLPVLERGSQRPDPTFVTRREGRLSSQVSPRNSSYAYRISSSFEPVTQNLSCVAVHGTQTRQNQVASKLFH